jgi:CRP-like cAMP-binding protein
MGMLTGTAGGAPIAALRPAVVYELTKADLRHILETRPEIAHELSRALARKLAAGRTLERPAVDATLATKGISAWLSVRMRRLFEVNSAK